MAAENKITIRHETLMQSWASDAGTFVMLTGMIGVGWFLGSEAMQWLGAVTGFLWLLSRGMKNETCLSG